MYLTQTNIIRGLTKQEYSVLRELCAYSNNLYNVGLYAIRQHYFAEKKHLPYQSNCKECKFNENFSLLRSHLAQQVLRVLDQSFRSFFALNRKKKNGTYGQKVGLPHYRKKGGLFNLICPSDCISIKNGMFRVPMSRKFQELYGKQDIKIPFPKRIDPSSVKEVVIVPRQDGRYFKIQYIYEIQEQQLNLNKDNSLAIDLGIDNLATCVQGNGTSYLLDGRRLKSINHYWNKKKARFQSVASKQGLRTTRRLRDLAMRRNFRVEDIIRKTARYIVNRCISEDIGTIVVGYSKDFKRSVNIGRVNNQNFTQIPIGDLRNKLNYLCEQYGMDYIEVEESYTSKASFLDQDELPKYDPEKPFTASFSGKRVKRGLYRSSSGRLVNADVNGACNILRKSKRNFNFERLCMGLLASPLRIRLV